MPNSVKFFDSTMPNSPVLNGQVGALVSLLDACLVNGFGSVAISSMIIADDVATVTTSAPHGFSMAGLTGPVVKISGASVTAVNTEWRVASVTNTTKFLIAMPGVTGPVSGTMSVKYAPLGWTKPFEGTNKAAYKGNAQSNGHYLRVLDDSTVPTTANGRWANIRGFETMTSVDDGTGLFPTAIQAANGMQVMKSKSSDVVARQWAIVGDGVLFYLFTFWQDSSYLNHASGYCFGKTGSLRPADGFDTLIVGNDPSYLTLPSYPGHINNFSGMSAISSPQTGKFFARSYTQLGSAVAAGFSQPMGCSQAAMGYSSSSIAYPSVNSGLLVSPVGVHTLGAPRSFMLPGIYSHYHDSVLSHLDVLDNITGVSDRTLRCYNLAYSSNPAQCLIDITGPWR